MSRLPELERAQLPAAAQAVYDEILASRKGNLSGPFRVWLHSPEWARRAARLGEFARYLTRLPLRQSELAILVTARGQRCPTEWAIHAPIARQAGLEAEIVDALARDEKPAFSSPQDEALYDFCAELNATKTVGEATLARLIARFDAATAVEVTGLVGYYTLVAMTLNVFDVRPGE
ncbi:MAG: carboxymuconolactone decarboxylase family protein [Verrucomicrobia bacterium]|nr:carboxymuconolactone decarboxylase family protein [Verrucomicrobiota bacterium]